MFASPLRLAPLAAVTILFAATAAGADHANSPAAARELLRKARDGRAVWKDFPGFTAELDVHIDGRQTKGRLEVAADGKAKIELADEAAAAWMGQQLHSLVDHRLPDYISDEHVVFAGGDDGHPLGRKIALGDEPHDSHYRIRDAVVTEVHRQDGDREFTISVLSIVRNQEGKYLPQDYTVTFWNKKQKAIVTNHSARNLWKRVGAFDLPAEVLEVQVGPDKRVVKQCVLSNHRLNGKQP